MFDIFSVLVWLNVVAAVGISESPAQRVPADSDVLTRSAQLERLDDAKFKSLVRNRHGRALFVNFWATWCAPCVEEFPDIVRIANEMKERNIDFVGVSADYFEDESTKVIPFIAKHNASFKFYIAKLEGEDAFIDAIDKKWGGGLPATFVYDSHGRRKAFLLGKQSYQSLKSAIEGAVDR